MKKENLTSNFPPKSFAEKFAEKQNAFVNLGYEALGFTSSKNNYKQIFEYDIIVDNLKHIIAESKNIEFDETLATRITRHFSKIVQLCDFLDQLNANDQRNAQVVFQHFDQSLDQSGLRGNISYRVAGRDIASTETLLGNYINDVAALIKEVEGPQQLPDLEIEFEKFEKKLESAQAISDVIISNEKKYIEAQKAAENWIKTEGRAIASAVQDKTKIFKDKADNEHTGWNVWPWLVGVAGFAFFAIVVSTKFIDKLSENGESISIGAALLRISVVGMFFYMAFLCYQQFNIQRRLYEIYKFKAIALSTMESLVKTFTEQKDREVIVNKAIEIIFTEPSFKEDKVAHQRVIDELLDVVKKKI